MVREAELKSTRHRDPEITRGDLPHGDGLTTRQEDKRGPFSPGGPGHWGYVRSSRRLTADDDGYAVCDARSRVRINTIPPEPEYAPATIHCDPSATKSSGAC